jgi:hypothetical protein
MIQIKKVTIGSAVKVGAIFSALSWAIFGLLFLGFQGLILTSLSSAISRSSSDFGTRSGDFGAAFGTVSIATLCIFYVVGLVLSLIFGAISGAIYAFIYNLTSGWVGGLEVEMSRMQEPEKLKTTLPPM